MDTFSNFTFAASHLHLSFQERAALVVGEAALNSEWLWLELE